MKIVLAVFLVSVFGGVLCVQAEDEINLQEVADKLPEELVGKLNVSSLPTREEAEKLFKEKCKKESGSDEAFEKANAAKDVLTTCVKSIIDIEEVKQEMEKAKPSGDLDLVFKKYCQLTPRFKECVWNFIKSIEPCLDKEERNVLEITQNVTDSLADFVCFKEGDRIALFIAEGGPECLSSKQEEVKECVNTTLSKYIDSDFVNSPSIDKLPKLVLNAEECHDLMNLQQCVVRKLEECEEPTPANIVESLFKFIRNQTPCSTEPESASSVHVQSAANTFGAQTKFALLSTMALGLSARYLF